MKKPKQFKPKRFNSEKKYKRPGLLTAREKGYDSVWEKYRWRFLYHNPKCYCCGAKSNVVDHIQAHKGDRELFENTTNHLPLCAVCHNTLTGLYDRHEVQNLEGKLNWIAETRKFYNINIKVKVLTYYAKKKR